MIVKVPFAVYIDTTRDLSDEEALQLARRWLKDTFAKMIGRSWWGRKVYSIRYIHCQEEGAVQVGPGRLNVSRMEQ